MKTSGLSGDGLTAQKVSQEVGSGSWAWDRGFHRRAERNLMFSDWARRSGLRVEAVSSGYNLNGMNLLVIPRRTTLPGVEFGAAV